MSTTDGFDGRTADADEILEHAALMPGRSFADLVRFEGLDTVSSPTNKGTVGTASEAFFGMVSDNSPEPDFRAAGIELKTVPLRPRDGEVLVKERVYITMIDYITLANEEWSSASIRRKLARILFVYYDWLPQAVLGDLVVSDVVLWEPSEPTLTQFERDWLSVRDLVRRGRAEDVSQSLGAALVAATKGRGGPPERRQPHSAVLASPRAWALRPAFVRGIVERHRLGRKFVFEATTALASQAMRVLARHASSSVAAAEASVDREPTRAKHRASLVIGALLAAGGGPTVRELLDSGVDVRAVQVDSSLRPYEHLSYPAFRYQELILEEWGESELLARLDRLLLVPIVGRQGLDALGDAIILPPVLWAPSEHELTGMEREWTMYRDEIRSGRANELTPASRTEYLHVRPHGRNKLDSDPAPGIGPVVKKAFWFNRDFVARILREEAGST